MHQHRSNRAALNRDPHSSRPTESPTKEINMPTIQPQPPVLVTATDAETLADGPTSVITLLADAAATHGALTVNRSLLRKGSPGAPAHFHTRATETFFVIDGTLQMLAGEQIL